MKQEKWDKMTDEEIKKWREKKTARCQIITYVVMYIIFIVLFKSGVL